jgi:thioredoxin-related protein
MNKLLIGLLVCVTILSILIFKNIENLEDTKDINIQDSKYINVQDKIKNGQLVMFKSNTCEFCRQMMVILNENNLLQYITVLDITSQTGKLEFNQLGESSVPLIKSNITGKIHYGYTDNIVDIIKNLSI